MANREKLVQQLAIALCSRGWMMATAESCTGGGIAECLTSVPGSSSWFDSGLVTYSNRAKTELLGVESDIISAHGAVSEEVAIQMANGALKRTDVELSISVTGIAGPDGGTVDKPVGTVYFACCIRGQAAQAKRQHFPGNRQQVRTATIEYAIQMCCGAFLQPT